MKDKQVLFQIKSLHQIILRNFLDDIKNKDYKTIHQTPTQMQIIEYIMNHEDTNQRDLEQVLNLRRATVSGVLKTMEKNGLIERIVNTTDARVKKIVLNSNAKKMFIKNVEKINNLEDVTIKNISKEDLKVFSNVLNMMKHNLKENINKKGE